MYRRRNTIAPVVLLALVIALLFAARPMTLTTTVHAQDDAPLPPLLDLLARVPANAAIPGEQQWIFIDFADYAAIDAAREGVPVIPDWAALQALGDAGDEGFDLWVANRLRLNSGLDDLLQINWLMLNGERVEHVLGFDLLDIEQVLSFGRPPSRSYALRGDFDPEAIVAAHTARDYTLHDLDGEALLCGWVGGCEDPLARDMDTPVERDPETLRLLDENSLNHAANPFGGQQRRQYPLVVLPGYVFSGQQMERLGEMVAATHGEEPSLLDVPEYRAVAEALTADNVALLQVHFMHPLDVMVPPTADVLGAMLGAGGDIAPELLDALMESYGLDDPA
ncbi:MAG: hypothetical protein JW910_09965, partial [Anaerolineae bacterium]|nr:hypothetical protein [Anaerolineae bacterium]